jgi:predicted RNase H-like HicB family nuclease/antitoxin (DNA-binding transcriptional repressor) of toxin-antitoxin stability system
MIRRDIEEFAADVPRLVDAAQRDAVVISRAGEPVARLLGVRGKDWEDLELESSPEFWQMIEERRREPSVPLREVERELFADVAEATPAAGTLIPVHSRYSMLIHWSDEDEAFIVTLPEFHGQRAHGASYEDAVRSGHELIETLMEAYQAEGRPLPAPATLQPSAAA